MRPDLETTLKSLVPARGLPGRGPPGKDFYSSLAYSSGGDECTYLPRGTLLSVARLGSSRFEDAEVRQCGKHGRSLVSAELRIYHREGGHRDVWVDLPVYHAPRNARVVPDRVLGSSRGSPAYARWLDSLSASSRSPTMFHDEFEVREHDSGEVLLVRRR